MSKCTTCKKFEQQSKYTFKAHHTACCMKCRDTQGTTHSEGCTQFKDLFDGDDADPCLNPGCVNKAHPGYKYCTSVCKKEHDALQKTS